MVHSGAYDKFTLILTGFLGFIAGGLENVNLSLSIVVKAIAVLNFIVYVILNWRRLYLNIRLLFKKKKKKMRKDVIFILDPGHGGMIGGKYVTAPNKMYSHPGGPTIYEGHFNREIVKKLSYKLKSLGIPFFNVANTPEDVPLSKRVEVANDIARKWNKKAVYISVHANAGGGKGFEVYTSKGETKSDKIADLYIDAMEQEFPNSTARLDLSDGDKDKEANFYVLKNTICPAILTENFFMDTLEDAKIMMSYEGQVKVVNAHLKTIQKTLELDIWDNKPKPKPKPVAKKKEPVKPKTPVAKKDNTKVAAKPKPRVRKKTKK